MRFDIVTVILFSVGLLSTSSQAASYTFSLKDLSARVRSSQADLKAARFQVQEARGRLTGSGRWSNPELGLETKRSRDFREWTVGLSFDQKFPLTSRLSLEKQLSAKAVEIAELEIQEIERKLIAEAQKTAIQWLAAEESLAMRAQQWDLSKKLNAFAATGAERGEISALDAAQMRLESQQFEFESRKAKIEKLTLQATLKQLLGLQAKDTLKLTGSLPSVSLPASHTAKLRPDLQASKLKEEASEKAIDLAKSKKWEDLNVGVFAEGERAEDAPDGLQNEAFVGFRVSIAWPWWNKNEGEIEERTAQAERAKAETAALKSAIDQEAALAREEMQAHADLALATERELLPLVEKQTRELEAAFETGQTDLVTVLRSREQQLRLKATVLEAKRDFHLARVRYEAATGAHVKAPSVSK